MIKTLDYAVLQICFLMQVMYASTALSDATAARTKAFVHLAKNCVTGDPRGKNDCRGCKSRKEYPQKLIQLSPRSHPKHLVGKQTAQEDAIKDITSDIQEALKTA